MEQPTSAAAMYAQGISAYQRGQFPEAVDSLTRAVQAEPASAIYRGNLGLALKAAGRLDEAIQAYQAALKLDPTLLETHINLAAALEILGRFDEAIDSCHQAIGSAPPADERAARRHVLAHNNLGNVLRRVGRLDEAMAAYDRAIELDPRYAQGHFNRSNLLLQHRRLDEAVAGYRTAIALSPRMGEAHANLANALKQQGLLDESIAAWRLALGIDQDNAIYHSNLCVELNYHPGYSAEMIAEEVEHWRQRHGKRSEHPRDREAGSTLRIGYVSADFCDHAVARLLMPLLTHHDRKQVELFLYSNGSADDAIARRFGSLGTLRQIGNRNDDQADAQIDQDRIDVLVDLSEHTAGNRLPLFARQPAPVQVSWMGIPAPAGVDAIGHRITDRYLDPPEHLQAFAGEKLMRLPDCMWCYDPLIDMPAVNLLPAVQNGFVTFGALNAFYKTNADVLRVWAQVLRAVPNSRLLMLCGLGSHRERTSAALMQQGIERERVRFVELGPARQYLEHYQGVDLILDPWPYNGHTTSFDALWMGIPIVSLAGTMPVGRAGVSLLSNLHLPELIARTEAEYVTIATSLAGDLRRLAGLRATLRERMQCSPLMEGPRFARGMEAIYQQLVHLLH